jgi:hypothetical protein
VKIYDTGNFFHSPQNSGEVVSVVVCQLLGIDAKRRFSRRHVEALAFWYSAGEIWPCLRPTSIWKRSSLIPSIRLWLLYS